ncbi:hypothetical protein LC092_06440 [Stappia stellulata]|uniref:hypothetical protein n=1 Tax=Stappia stellulata TaxID=71235 RepID=UPI001CD3D8CB|nr:hypothetical protein [Stappia stellulata]MCA1242068.1 hypothetical protein [Stappia stellulata]
MTDNRTVTINVYGGSPTGHVSISFGSATYEQTVVDKAQLEGSAISYATSSVGPIDGVVQRRPEGARSPDLSVSFSVSKNNYEKAHEFAKSQIGKQNYGVFTKNCVEYVDKVAGVAGVFEYEWREAIYNKGGLKGSYPVELLIGKRPTISVWDAEGWPSDFPKCFPSGTLIQGYLFEKNIKFVLPNDIIFSFDPSDNNGRGGLVPRRVTRTFTNITEEWLRLKWVENGEEKELVTTPGHHFLDRFGNFPQIERLIADGAATVILADGSEATVTAGRIVCSAATDDRFAQAIGWVTPSNRGRVLKSRRLRQTRRCSVRFKRQKHVSSPALEERLRRCADQSVRVIARSVSAGVLHSGLQEQSSRSVCAALKKRSGQICRCALL